METVMDGPMMELLVGSASTTEKLDVSESINNVGVSMVTEKVRDDRF